MAGEWPVVAVEELADSVSNTHNFGKNRLIFLNTSDVFHGKILHHSYSTVAGWPGQAKKSIQRNDILFSEIRPANGRWAYVDVDAEDYVVSTKLMVIRPRRSRVVPRFLYHFLTSSETTRRLQHLAESRSGTFPEITFDQVAELELPLPPFEVQEQIAAFFDAIDDKIELNRQMNETLEAMARAIFKSWFVDFDPVRAKAEGLDAGLPKHIADLFPDRFEDSELGEIPAGWEGGAVLSRANLLSGGTPKTEKQEYWNGGIPWASAKDVSQCGETFLITTERTITQTGLDESSTQMIPAFCTVVVARGATTGRLVMFGRQMAMNQTCYGLASTTGTPVSLYCLLRHEMDSLVHSAHGSVFDTITTSTFANSKMVLAPVPLLKAFDHKVAVMFHRILANTKENQMLAALREALLPKLISGELRVKTVARFISEMV